MIARPRFASFALVSTLLGGCFEDVAFDPGSEATEATTGTGMVDPSIGSSTAGRDTLALVTSTSSTGTDLGFSSTEGSSGGPAGSGSGSTGTPASDTAGSTDEGSEGPDSCGNGLLDGGEACDGAEMGGHTCVTQAGVGSWGVLRCDEECTFDLSSCSPYETVVVPEGTFVMGNAPVSAPVRNVSLDGFRIGRTEVTVAEFQSCVDAGVCDATEGGEVLCFHGQADRGDYPVNCVTWYQADAFCRFIGGRLPTEAEWEKAARGTEGASYPWGEDPPSCDLVVMDEAVQGCGTGLPMPVGSVPEGASPYGALDMAGNLWEWVGDWYEPYDPEALENPRGPATGTRKILRGGSFADPEPEAFFTFARHQDEPENPIRERDGFRCVLPGTEN